MASCGGGSSPSSSTSADAGAACASGGACAVCGSDSVSAAAANGASCGPGMVCLEGICMAGCFIDGFPAFPGERAPSGGECRGCNPKASTSAWSGLDDGSSCAGGANTVCVAGSCVSGCSIGQQGYAAGTVNPSNPCEGCVPPTNLLDWSSVTAEGAPCGTGRFCFDRTCAPGCSIGGTAYPSGTRNPSDSCQICVPGESTTSWTNAADGSSCDTGGGVAGQSCCAGVCVDPSSDPNNCGACGHSCVEPPSPTCAGGHCASKLGSTGYSAARLAVDATNVYWTTSSTVMQAPIAGGAPTTLASDQIAEAVVVDDTHVYFSSAFVSGTLVSVPIGGGAPTVLSTTFGGNRLALRGGYIYGTIGNDGDSAKIPAVARMPVSGGTAISLAPLQSIVDLTGLAVDDSAVYWATSSGVMKTAIAGGATTTLVVGNGSPLAVDANDVYYGFDGLGGSNTIGPLLAQPIGGGTVTTLATGPYMIEAIAVDANDVYWAAGGEISRVPVHGGAITQIASGQPDCGGIVLDETHVYWASLYAVMRASK